VYTCSGLGGGTAHSVLITALSGVNIEGRTFRCVAYVRGVGADVGKKIRIVGNRTSGGASVYTSNTITLTADWVAVTTSVIGVSSNTGVNFIISGDTVDTASGCQFKHPTLVEVTDRSNKTPPLPIPVDTPHEYAREIYTTANALGSVNNADSTTGVPSSLVDTFRSQQVEVPPGYSNAIEVSSNVTPAGAARLYIDLDALFSLVDGKRYAISYWLRHVGTGGQWSNRLGDDSTASASYTNLVSLGASDTTWTYYEHAFTHGSDTQIFCRERD
jgi:hypothetical protein